MNQKKRGLRNFRRGTEGATGVITAMSLMALLGMAALAVDMGHLYTVRNQLQNSADAAALAAAGNLIVNLGGVAVRDATAARNSAILVAQRQSQLSGLPAVGDGARDDVVIIFGEWNLLAANPSVAWTEIGPSCSSGSNANAVKVTLSRAPGTAYGPVTNFFAGIFGYNASRVSASATAYLGYVNSTETGGVTLPLAIPSAPLSAANPGSNQWLARILGPAEAIASAPRQITFRDLGSETFYQGNQSRPLFDLSKAYLFVVNNADSVPGTVINNIKKTYTSGTPIRPMARGTHLYPISEYQWASNIKDIFNTLKSAYNAKKNAQGKWRVTVPVYTTSQVSQRLMQGLFDLAKLLSPWATEAHACFTFWSQSYPGGNVPIYVNGFANVDVVNVTYNSSCDSCSSYRPAQDGQTYSSALDCLVRSSGSCRNTNSVTIEIPVDASSVAPPGTSSGGPSFQGMNPAGSPTAGAVATIPRLVK